MTPVQFARVAENLKRRAIQRTPPGQNEAEVTVLLEFEGDRSPLICQLMRVDLESDLVEIEVIEDKPTRRAWLGIGSIFAVHEVPE